MSSQTVGVFGLPSKSIIPKYAREHKREYQFIKGINNEFGYLKIKFHHLNKGTYKSKKAEKIKYFIKKYLMGREKGKLGDTGDLDFKSEDLGNIIFFVQEYSYYRMDGDVYGDYEGPYKGLIEFYEATSKFLAEIKYDTSDSDSDSDFEIILPSDSDSD